MENEQKPVIMWVLVAAAAILAIGMVVQIVWPDTERSAEPTSSPSVSATASSSQRADLACLENPPIPNPAAPAYQGRGPHLIIPGTPARALGGRLYALQIDEGYLPRGWLPPNHTELTASWWDSSMAALIVCPTEVRQTGSKPVGTCEWRGFAPTRVYPATWTFAVYEIRTGRKVLTFSLPSDSSKGRTCPTTMQAPPHDNAQPPSSGAFEAALRPLVTRDVP